VNKTKINKIKIKSDVFSASGIGQYTYCSTAWYLKRLGYEPTKSIYLKEGFKKHKKIGLILDNIENKQKKSKIIALMGYIILFFVILTIILELI
jgi:hypothetical protein